MNQRSRYITILICAIITPIAFYFLPLFSISNYQLIAGNTYSVSLADAFQLYQAQLNTAMMHPAGSFLMTLITMSFIAFILNIIFAGVKKRIGVLTTSLIGTLIMTFFLSIALITVMSSTYISYSSYGRTISQQASVGLALWIPFILSIVNLMLAATDCKIVYVPQPSYPGYYPNPQPQNPYQQNPANTYYAPQQPNQFQQTQQNSYGAPSAEPSRYNPNLATGTVKVVPPVAPQSQQNTHESNIPNNN